MATQTFNWCTRTQLECGSALPTTAYICVPPAIVDPSVETANGIVEATITAVRVSTCEDVCGPCGWVYTFTYDDEQLVNGYVLVQHYVKHVICSSCLTDLMVNLAISPTCEAVEECTQTAFVSNENELIDALAGSYENIWIIGTIILTNDLDITKPVFISGSGWVATSGHVLTISGSFSAGSYQVFDTSANEVIWGKLSTPYILVEWFGATEDYPIDSTAAIQLAVDSSVAGGTVTDAWIPVTPLTNREYGITTVNLPFRCVIESPGGRTSGAQFKGLAAAPMFVMPSSAGSERQITMRGGMVINGMGLATVGIDAGFLTGTVIESVSIRDVTSIGIDQSEGGTINRFSDLRFSSTVPTSIKIGGVSNYIVIDRCMFAAASTVHIHADNTWVGGALDILTNVFDPSTGCVDTIRIERANNGSPTLHANICNNRFDGGATTSHINIGQYAYVNISGNGMSGGSGFPGVVVNGDECTVTDNYFGNAGIVLGANSRGCNVGYNKWGGGFTTITDSGSNNVITPFIVSGSGVGFPATAKGTTLQRPVLLSTGMMGFTYLDTTIDADGKAIFWNGTAWVDATGAVV